jgi:hypothetical protein
VHADGSGGLPPSGRYASTSLWWVVASVVVVLALSVVQILLLRAEVQAYNTAYAAAAPGGSATVVRSVDRLRYSDVIEVEWLDLNGQRRWHAIRVERASRFPVGRTLPIRRSPTAPDQFFPEDGAGIIPTARATVGIGLLLSGSLVATTFWLWRAARWWHAGRAPAKRYRASLQYSYGFRKEPTLPWLIIEEDGRRYYQRAMWEPWVASVDDDLEIEGRRVGRGPFVVDVPGYGRLWPAGRARLRPPKRTALVPGRADRYRSSRFASLAVLSLVIMLLVILSASWLGGLVSAGYVWLLVLYLGGPPAPVPWLRPRQYRRIKPDPP